MLHTCIHVRSHLWSLWLVSPTLPLFSPPLHTMLGELQPCLFPQPTCCWPVLAAVVKWGASTLKASHSFCCTLIQLFFIPFSNAAHTLPLLFYILPLHRTIYFSMPVPALARAVGYTVLKRVRHLHV